MIFIPAIVALDNALEPKETPVRPYEAVKGSFQAPRHFKSKEEALEEQKKVGGWLLPSALGGYDLVYIRQ